MEDGYRACLGSRIAMRILRPLAEFPATKGEDLYDGVGTVDWSEFLTKRHTLAVRATCVNSAMTHSLFIAQKTKDAIVDQLREKTGERPSVDLESPDVTVSVHVAKNLATVYVDLAGAPLHRRGYRTAAGEAPLKETLAAAMVRLSGWDRARPFIDPMCGSGRSPSRPPRWPRTSLRGSTASDSASSGGRASTVQAGCASCESKPGRRACRSGGPSLQATSTPRWWR